MEKQYTYYGFWDDLCAPGEYDNYRMGPNGLEYQYREAGEYRWAPSSYENMDQMLKDALGFGKAKYWEIDVD